MTTPQQIAAQTIAQAIARAHTNSMALAGAVAHRTGCAMSEAVADLSLILSGRADRVRPRSHTWRAAAEALGIPPLSLAPKHPGWVASLPSLPAPPPAPPAPTPKPTPAPPAPPASAKLPPREPLAHAIARGRILAQLIRERTRVAALARAAHIIAPWTPVGSAECIIRRMRHGQAERTPMWRVVAMAFGLPLSHFGSDDWQARLLPSPDRMRRRDVSEVLSSFRPSGQHPHDPNYKPIREAVIAATASLRSIIRSRGLRHSDIVAIIRQQYPQRPPRAVHTMISQLCKPSAAPTVSIYWRAVADALGVHLTDLCPDPEWVGAQP